MNVFRAHNATGGTSRRGCQESHVGWMNSTQPEFALSFSSKPPTNAQGKLWLFLRADVENPLRKG